MAGPVDLDHRLRSAAGPQPDTELALADVLQRIRRRTRRTVVAAATVVAVVGALVAVWVVDGPGSERSPVMVGVPTSPATSETSPSNERPSEVGRRPLAEEQVVARGEVDGEQWRLKAQPFENGIICLELSGGGCGVIPTDEGPLGAVFHTADSIEGSRFVFGAVIVEAAEVTLELANGEELSVTASPPTFGFRFYAIPVPAGPDAVAVTARDPAGVELERVDLA
jgi:hypothetical protein